MIYSVFLKIYKYWILTVTYYYIHYLQSFPLAFKIGIEWMQHTSLWVFEFLLFAVKAELQMRMLGFPTENSRVGVASDWRDGPPGGPVHSQLQPRAPGRPGLHPKREFEATRGKTETQKVKRMRSFQCVTTFPDFLIWDSLLKWPCLLCKKTFFFFSVICCSFSFFFFLFFLFSSFVPFFFGTVIKLNNSVKLVSIFSD